MNLTTPRTHERPERGTVLLSGGIHVFLVVAVWALTALRPVPIEYETIAISLYSPPPAAAEEVVAAAPQEEELQVETPEPEPDPEDVPLPEVQEEVTPPPPDPAPETPPEPEDTTEEETATAPSDEPQTEEAGDDLNIRQAGVQRDYPEYYNNIIAQIRRCFRGSAGAHRAVVKFTILRDGSAADIDIAESSGSVAFEVSALEAVECAGRMGFGPLPSEIAYDELPILFSFDPRG